MNKILTISIAAYNIEDYIKEALDSIISNEKARECVEVIVVDDGSKDQTLEIANKYQAQFPETIIVIKKNNGGYGSTINEALKIAHGKYFKLLDGDDWFSNNLTEYLNILEQQDADLILSPYYRVHTVNNRYELVSRHQFNNGGDSTACDSNLVYIHAAETAVQTKCIKNKMIISEHCFYTDVEYVHSVCRFSKSVFFINLPIYCYRIGREGQSVSIKSRLKNRQDASFVSLKLCEDYRQHKEEYASIFADGQITQIATIIVFYCKTLLYMKNLKEAKKEMNIFLQKIKKYPEIFDRVLLINRSIKLCIKIPILFGVIAKYEKLKNR